MAESADPRQPVLVGIGTVLQRIDDPALAQEPLALMLAAARQALDDAGLAAGGGIDWIAVPQGRWRYRNPAGAIARALGAPDAHTLLSTLGVLQQTLLAEACQRIAAGEVTTALVVGGEASHRLRQARRTGQRAAETQQDDDPRERLRAAEDLLHPAEVAAGIRLPAPLYALLSSAWVHARGIDPQTHRAGLGGLYEAFARVAADNPDAWQRRRFSAAEIAEPSERNPLQAHPYTRLQCASMHVDQAAALLLTSVGQARRMGVPQDRWVHPWGSSESRHVVPVSARAELADCAGARVAGRTLLGAFDLPATAIDRVDLYNCFPIALEMCADAIGLPLDPARPPTVTGGMSFAGGPFNHYVLQATARLAAQLRGGAGRTGLVSCVSGVLNKVGFGLWGRSAGPAPFRSWDVSAAVAALSAERPVVDGHAGSGRVAAWTVVQERGEAPRALVLADTDGGARALAWNDDPGLAARAVREGLIGEVVRLDGRRFHQGAAP